MGHSYDGQERRRHARFSKNYNLTYHVKGSDLKRSDATSIKDISKSGLRFTTSHEIVTGTYLVFEISVPYIAPNKLVLEGTVISSHEIASGLVYEIRVHFNSLDEETIKILNIIENRNLKELKKNGLY